MLPLCSPFQQARRFLNTDLLGIQAVENCPAIDAAISFRWATKRGYNIIQAATCSVVCDIEVSRNLLNIATVLDKQLDKLELFAAQATDPAQTEPSLDHDAAIGTFQPGND